MVWWRTAPARRRSACAPGPDGLSISPSTERRQMRAQRAGCSAPRRWPAADRSHSQPVTGHQQQATTTPAEVYQTSVKRWRASAQRDRALLARRRRACASQQPVEHRTRHRQRHAPAELLERLRVGKRQAAARDDDRRRADDQQTLEAAGEWSRLAVAEGVVFVGRALGDRHHQHGEQRRARLTKDSIASDSRPTEPA